jgi:hypothetical protein
MHISGAALTIGPSAIAAYVGTGVSALLAVAALVVSLRSLGIQRESARAATISAEAAQRANWLTEQRLGHEVNRPSSTAQQPEGGLMVAPVTPDVRWSLDRKSKNTYVLRNVGTHVAEEVRIPPEGAAPVSRNLPESATLRPQESVEFLMIPAAGFPVPNEIMLMWKGRGPDNPLLLPVPS